ncbi:amidohydrolase [Sulfurihydrogenibium subterraneum]|uniref:amidohydrolase n=1 Tax=Sulfurihydrogenibium subterraneum TaxID=171121 RepID=UPI00048D6DFF|nr:amidohydrolase [Sulfurihydrogenibium subterraneum]
MFDLVLKNCYILTMDENFTEYKNGYIVIKDGKIAEVGEGKSEFEAKEVIDLNSNVVLPGLINTHTHAAMTLLRGYGSDNPLKVWLEQYIWPVEGKYVSYEFVKDGTDLACYEMIRNGITCFVDMYFYEDAVAQSVKEAGMKAVLTTGILDFPTPAAKTPEEGIQKTKDFIIQYRNDNNVFPAIGPHAPYTCSPNTLTKAMEVALDYNVLYHIHVSETINEVEDIKNRYGNTPVKHLNSIGVLNERVLAAHMVHPTEEEIEILSEKKVKIAHCPESNLKLASGIAPVPKMLEKEIVVSLGTDGTASNDDLDLIGEASTAAKLHKGYNLNPTVLPAKQVLAMITRQAAKAILMEDRIGSIEVGKDADIIVIDVNQPHLQPLFDPYTQIIYSGKGLDVNTVIINGKVVMKNKVVQTVEKDKVLYIAKKWREKIING